MGAIFSCLRNGEMRRAIFSCLPDGGMGRSDPVEHSVRGDIGTTPLRNAPPGGGSNAPTAGSNAPTVADTKFGSEMPTMVFGNESAYRDGLLARTGQPTRSVWQEFARNDHGRWLRELEYVALLAAVRQYPASKGSAPNPEQEPAYTRDLEHRGKRLDDFWRQQPQFGKERELSRAEVAVLRLYTGPWFKVINFYLRYLPVVECCTSTPYHVDDSTFEAYDVRRFFLQSASESDTCRQCGKPRSEHHRQQVDSWATSASLLYRGIVKLADVTENTKVYRGVKEKYVRLPDEFVQPTAAFRGFAGGVELGAMSTTSDKQVALSYMCENGTDVDCALFEIQFTAVSRGADLRFLSQYSAEREFLFPPGTSLTYRSKEIIKPGQRKLVLDAQFQEDTKLCDVVAPIKSLDYQPLDHLREILNPLDFGEELEGYGTRFVPGTRQWVFKEIDKWLADNGTGRCRVLLAGPGFGKTAIVARLCESRRDAVVGVHLCRHNHSAKRDPGRMVRTLTHQIANAIPEYRAALEHKEAQLAKEVDALGTTELFDLLLVQPLRTIRMECCKMLVIDALDEAEHDKKNELLHLIKTDFSRLPKWLKVLVTGRPEVPITESLRTLRPTELDAEGYAEDCELDVEIFLRHVLKHRVLPEHLEKAVMTVARKAERNFLYLYWVRKRLDEKKDTHAIDVEALPDGLADEYDRQLSRFYADGFSDDTSRVLRAIVAAEEPLHVHALPVLSGVNDSMSVLDILSLLFPVRDKCVHVFHKSIVDWLTASPPYEDRMQRAQQKGSYFVNRAEGNRMLADACAKNASLHRSNLASNPANLSHPSNPAATTYAIRWALHHCSAAGDWEKFERLATDLAHIDARFAAKSGATLGLDLGLAHGQTDRSVAIEPFERLVLKEMPVLLREGAGAIFQLACQQPNASPVYRSWESQMPEGRRHLEWKNKPEKVDACLLTISCHGTVKDFAQLAEGGHYVVAAETAVEVRDARNGELLETLSEGDHVSCVAACAGWICAGFESGTIKVWDAGTLELKSEKTNAHSRFISSVAFSPDGTKIVSGSYDQTIKVWDADSFDMIKSRRGDGMVFGSDCEGVECIDATVRMTEGGGAFYAPSDVLCVAIHGSRVVAGAASGELYHLEYTLR